MVNVLSVVRRLTKLDGKGAVMLFYTNKHKPISAGFTINFGKTVKYHGEVN